LTADHLFVSDVDFVHSDGFYETGQRRVRLYRLDDAAEVTDIADPVGGPGSTFGDSLVSDGSQVYTGTNGAIYGIQMSAATLILTKPKSAPTGGLFGYAFAANGKWLAVSCPYAYPSRGGSSSGYVAVYRRSNLSEPAAIYVAFPCRQQDK